MNGHSIFLDYDFSPLGARCALAMSRVMSTLDPGVSAELRFHAFDLAFTVGEMGGDASQVPALIAEEEDLVKAFQSGCRRAAAGPWSPPIVWMTEWQSDQAGLNDTRAMVARSDDGYLPGLEVFRRGGDATASFGSPLPSLEEAAKAATEREMSWHDRLAA